MESETASEGRCNTKSRRPEIAIEESASRAEVRDRDGVGVGGLI